MKHDPALYRRMSEPHSSGDDLQAALEAFYDEVEAARARHRIRDVVVITCGSALSPEGDEGDYSSSYFLGAATNRLPMIAQAYGAAREAHDAALAAAIRGPGRR